MKEPTGAKSPIRFGAFEADVSSGELRKHGLRIKLPDQSFQVLAMLLERPRQIVTREEFHKKLWPGDTFVDFDHGLNNAMNRLREALGDTADAPHFIETLLRRGYRFVANVDGAIIPGASRPTSSASPAERALPPTAEKATAQPPTFIGAQRPMARLWLPLSALAAGLAALLLLNPGRLRQRVFGGAPPARIQSIAVLPLENLSKDPEQEYFADGMTEALITDLGKISSLRVISRTSVMRYKGTRKTLPEIARELNVDAVVEGAVLHTPNRVRITAQLIRAAPEKHLWAESYERDLRDVLVLQNEVARAIASEIKIKLSPQEQTRLAGGQTINREAYEAYLMGSYYAYQWDKGTLEGRQKAREYLEQAIQKDPAWALPYAAKASALANLGLPGGPGDEKCAQARAAAVEALKKDEALAEAHFSMAVVKARCDWDWSAAELEAKRAIELNPSSADGHDVYSFALRIVGRTDEAIAEMKRAAELDPLPPGRRWHLGLTLYLARHYDEAAEQFRKALEREADFVSARVGLGDVYVEKGNLPEAIQEYQRALAIPGGNRQAMAKLGYAYAVVGRRKEAESLLRKLMELDVPLHWVAEVHIGLGQKQQALACLEKAVQTRRGGGMYMLRDDPHFDSLRSDPRFTDLLRRLGLPP